MTSSKTVRIDLGEKYADLVQGNVTRLSVGTLEGSGDFLSFIPAGSLVPIQVTIEGFTNILYADEIRLPLFLGVDPCAFNNTFIAEIALSLPEPKEEGFYIFDLRIDLSNDGSLEVVVLCTRPYDLPEIEWDLTLEQEARLLEERVSSYKHEYEEGGEVSVPPRVALVPLIPFHSMDLFERAEPVFKPAERNRVKQIYQYLTSNIQRRK